MTLKEVTWQREVLATAHKLGILVDLDRHHTHCPFCAGEMKDTVCQTCGVTLAPGQAQIPADWHVSYSNNQQAFW